MPNKIAIERGSGKRGQPTTDADLAPFPGLKRENTLAG